MLLPIPIEHNKTKYTEFNIFGLTNASVFDTADVTERVGGYEGFLYLLRDNIEFLSENNVIISDKKLIQDILKDSHMSNMFEIIRQWLIHNGKDKITGETDCAECGTEIKYIKTSSLDDRIDLKELKTIVAGNDYKDCFDILCDIKINDTIIKSLTFRRSKVIDWINAEKQSTDDYVKQMLLSKYCLLKINSKDVDDKYKQNYYESIFRKMPFEIFKQIQREDKKYSFENHKRNCLKCGTENEIKFNIFDFMGLQLKKL